MIRMGSFVAALAVVGSSGSARGADVTYLVAPGGGAAEHAAKKADGKSVVHERKLHKAFDLASTHLASCGACTVTIKLAGGAHEAKGKTGMWSFPDTVAPDATLRILGGWDETFAKRAPFSTPSVLVTVTPRSGPVIKFEGTKHALKELVISGLVIDVAPGNKYDAQTNSLLKGSSATWGIIAFGYLTTNKLVISDNVFLNGAHGVSAPMPRAATPDAEIIVRNNLFLNNVYCWQVKGSSGKHQLKRYLIEGNSFVLNWPFNPDTSTSNPGALEIGNKSTAGVVEIRGNLFAYNIGGAIFPQWDDKAGPKIAIQENLFWQNGALFEPKSDGEGAVVGKFNKAAVHGVYDPTTIEDDFSWDTRNNVVLDPKLGIPVLKIKAIGQSGKPADPPPTKDQGGDIDFFGEDKANIDVDTTVETEEYADDGKIKNYAPRMPYNPETIPFPTEPKAQKYGASAARVVTP